ncbi:MAG: phosphoribosylformylglycinamidine cyclo-ligase [Acidimicrobiales bacterium]
MSAGPAGSGPARTDATGDEVVSYAAAGVDIDAATGAVRDFSAAVTATHGPRVLSDVGSFGGLFDISDLGSNPVLVASADGVGTKVELAARYGRHRGVGHDLVNHCVNDILVQGARPLFFLDYVATASLDPAVIVEVVSGVAEACGAVGCAVLGGEVAEMPGVYVEGTLDVAGTIVGVVERDAVLPRLDEMAVGDVVVALPSVSPHTNGYSLIRRVLDRVELTDELLDWLLTPHRCYLRDVEAWWAAGVEPSALAHITGGGLIDNVPRVLPDHLAVQIDTSSWVVPEGFTTFVEAAGIDHLESHRTFNMGVGLVAVVAPDKAAAALAVVEGSWVIGDVAPSEGTGVVFVPQP